MSAQVYNLPFYQVPQPIVMNANFSLGWVPIYFLGYFAQIVWTGVPTGYFYLEASGDQFITGSDIVPPAGAPFYVKPGIMNPVNRSIITGSTYSVISAGSNAWNVSGARYNFVRVSYVDQSAGASTATLNFGNVTQKGPG